MGRGKTKAQPLGWAVLKLYRSGLGFLRMPLPMMDNPHSPKQSGERHPLPKFGRIMASKKCGKVKYHWDPLC